MGDYEQFLFFRKMTSNARARHGLQLALSKKPGAKATKSSTNMFRPDTSLSQILGKLLPSPSWIPSCLLNSGEKEPVNSFYQWGKEIERRLTNPPEELTTSYFHQLDYLVREACATAGRLRAHPRYRNVLERGAEELAKLVESKKPVDWRSLTPPKTEDLPKIVNCTTDPTKLTEGFSYIKQKDPSTGVTTYYRQILTRKVHYSPLAKT